MPALLPTTTATRRTVLRGMAVATMGVAGAALLGCGSAKPAASTSGAVTGAKIEGASSGGGLPLTAPVVQGKRREGGTWTSVITSTYKQHDPHTALGTDIWHIIGEKGLEPDPQTAAIRPHVFTSWEIADPTGMTLIFKLAPNLYMHDKAPWNGRQFTATDAAWNLERIAGLYAQKLKIPASSFQRASMVDKLVKAEAVDPLTVKVTLSKPNSSFFNGLMDTRVPFAPKEMDDIGWNDPLKMGGIGPYVVNEWVNDQKATFKRFDKYFRPGEPHFDTFQQIVVPDTAATQAAFISGQSQSFAVGTSDALATVRKAKADANLYTWIDSNWNHLRPSLEYAPFQDFRVRKAISMAIDYRAMNDGYYGVDSGWGYQASLCPGYPESWKPDKVRKLAGYNPDTKQADRAEAMKLLAAAGYPNGKGIDFDIIFNTSTDSHRENATRFQSMMPTVFTDMKVALKPYPDSASFSVPQAEGKFKMVAYNITSSPDAVIEFTSQYYSTGSRNYGHFSNKEADTLMDRAAVELNKDARTKMLDEAQTRFMDEWMPMFVLCANPVRTLVQSNIGGYDTTAGLWFGYSATTKLCRWYYVDK